MEYLGLEILNNLLCVYLVVLALRRERKPSRLDRILYFQEVCEICTETTGSDFDDTLEAVITIVAPISKQEKKLLVALVKKYTEGK